MMREVTEMAQVRGYTDGDTLTVECTECGPLGVCAIVDFDTIALDHMVMHGAEVAA